MIALNLLIIIICFGFIWYGSGLVLNVINNIAHKTNISIFFLSVFVLGLLTSLPEISISLNSLVQDEVEIGVGNLLGGVMLLLLFFIPLLLIFKRDLIEEFNPHLRTMFIIAVYLNVPALLFIDKSVSSYEAVILIGLYVSFLFLFGRKRNFIERLRSLRLFQKEREIGTRDFALMILGIIILIVCSRFIVINFMEITLELRLSNFVVSLIALAIGTNLPELTVGVRSLLMKEGNIALANYIGSAVANTFMLGILIFISGGVKIDSDFRVLLGFIFLGTSSIFALRVIKNDFIFRLLCFLLILCYFSFIIIESLNA